MDIIKKQSTPLSNDEIVNFLQEARDNAVAGSAHFAVSAVIEYQHEDGSYVYVCGVNVAHNEHDRLSMSAEENAVALANTLHGGRVKFSKVWVMGAPDTVKPGSEQPAANNFIPPCGYCREILLSHAEPNAAYYSVSVNGKMSEPTLLREALPSAFSGQDLTKPAVMPNVGSSSPRPRAMEFFTRSSPSFLARRVDIPGNLSDEALAAWGADLKPHSGFAKQPITACILKIRIDTKVYCYPGVLMQDSAFLTIDAIFSATNAAMTAWGKAFLEGNACIEEVHLFGERLTPLAISGCELSHLCCFSPQPTFKLHHQGQALSVATYTLLELTEARAERELVNTTRLKVASR